MTISRSGVGETSLIHSCFALLAIGLLLWTASAALSSRDLIRIDLRVPLSGAESQRPARDAPTLLAAALDVDGDGMPDISLRWSVTDFAGLPVARRATGPTAARRLTSRQLTPLDIPPR